MPNFCSNCGERIKDEDKFCRKCGTRVDLNLNDELEKTKDVDFYDDLNRDLEVDGLYIKDLNLLENHNKDNQTNSLINNDSDNLESDISKQRALIIHYFLIPLNVFLPWSIVSWVGIPLSLYARNRLKNLKERGLTVSKSHIIWTNISIGVFVFYLLVSIIRAAII